MTDLYVPSLSEALAVSHTHGDDSECPELWKGLVANYCVLQSGGKELLDFSGYRKNGTLTNMTPATAWVMTEEGWAIQPPAAVSPYINCGLASFLAGKSAASFAAWGKVTNTTHDHTLCDIFGANLDHSAVFCDIKSATGNLRVGGRSADVDTFQSATYEADVTTGLVHIAGVIDLPATTIRVYLDGKEVASNTNCTFNQTTFNSDVLDGGFNLCNDGSPDDANTWEDWLAQFILWDRVLGVAEIRQLYDDPWAMLRPQVRVYPVVEAPGENAMPMAIHHYKMAGAL